MIKMFLFSKIYIIFYVLIILLFYQCQESQLTLTENNDCIMVPTFSQVNKSKSINLDFNISYLQDSTLIPTGGLPSPNIQDSFEQFTISCRYGENNNPFEAEAVESNEFLVQCTGTDSRSSSWQIVYENRDSFLLERTRMGAPYFLSYNYSALDEGAIETISIEMVYNSLTSQILNVSKDLITATLNRSIKTQILSWDTFNRPSLGISDYYLNVSETPYCTGINTIYSYSNINYTVISPNIEESETVTKIGVQQLILRTGGIPTGDIPCPIQTESERTLFDENNFIVEEEIQIEPAESNKTTYIIGVEENVCPAEN